MSKINITDEFVKIGELNYTKIELSDMSHGIKKECLIYVEDRFEFENMINNHIKLKAKALAKEELRTLIANKVAEVLNII